MTIEETIKNEEELAKENEELYRLCPASESDMFHCDGIKDCKSLKNGKNKGCQKCADEHRQLAEWLKELKAHRDAWEKCIKEIKEWYWNADKQAIAKDPCVVDAMIDLFIRTIKECRPKEGDTE